MKSLSRVRLFATLWTVTYQAPLSKGFSRQEYWSGLFQGKVLIKSLSPHTYFEILAFVVSELILSRPLRVHWHKDPLGHSHCLPWLVKIWHDSRHEQVGGKTIWIRERFQWRRHKSSVPQSPGLGRPWERLLVGGKFKKKKKSQWTPKTLVKFSKLPCSGFPILESIFKSIGDYREHKLHFSFENTDVLIFSCGRTSKIATQVSGYWKG